MIAAAFANAPPPQVHVQAPVNGNGPHGSSLQPSDVGFFYPQKHTGFGVWLNGKVTKYFDVFHFIKRLKHLERLYSAEDVRRV
ncbi:hypothetical protein DHEL01_v209262 [Diaporthe helianthi]|uniref:Uncharacterized protein n=1 Tax=Diaporthe helianthi TaxID=158607 RepID=A0A2P5HPZ9_DIAHE|nr:hypothetical protein DHEL01_v209262 [Diaporthe helianthi]